jgi:hypothetical protein
MPFCDINRGSHSIFSDIIACPRCHLLNPDWPISEADREVIKILDDSPSPEKLSERAQQIPQALKAPQALFTADRKNVRSSQIWRFQAYNRCSVAELVQQMTTQKGGERSSSSTRPQTNVPNRLSNKLMIETYSTMTTIWIRSMRHTKQADYEERAKVSLKIQNQPITALNDLIDILLALIKAWGTSIKQEKGDSIYLAKHASHKSTPIELPKSADLVQSIKEAIQYFGVSGKEYIIHIIVERQLVEEIEQFELEPLFSEDSPLSIKKKAIKQE